MKKCFIYLFAIVTALSMINIKSNKYVSAESDIRFEEKVYSTATVEDDFEDDTVLVVVDKNFTVLN